MSLIIYEDTPPRDKWLSALLALPVVIIAVAALSLAFTQEREGAMFLLIEAVLLALLMAMILPRKYRILDDKVEIVLGGPFRFNVPFKTIKGVKNATWKSIGINLPTSLSSKNGVEIARKRCMSVNITPGDRQAFLENLERTMKSWSIYYGRTA
jgi:hypothetical protein